MESETRREVGRDGRDGIRGQRSEGRISNYAYWVRSACMGLEGWDIPEAAYVASLCLLRETTLPK